jgi:hypothetical protein
MTQVSAPGCTRGATVEHGRGRSTQLVAFRGEHRDAPARTKEGSMQHVRSILGFVPLLALSTAARATTDHYTFLVDSAQSQVQYEIDSNMGQCTSATWSCGRIRCPSSAT